MSSIRDQLHDSRTPTGIGIGLRGSLVDALAAGQDLLPDGASSLAFLEVSPENYMGRGGRHVDAFEALAERLPIITHGVALSLGSLDPLDPDYLRSLRDFVGRHGTSWHSDHLCFSGHAGAALHDLLPLTMTHATVERVVERIAEAREAIGKPLVIENISYYLPMPSEFADEAAFVREVCERADCGLLLDVNNIFVNSKNFGFDPFEVLAGYPLERVVQLHVAGHTRYERFGFWLDDHGAIAEPTVHAMMQWVIERVGPLPVLLERDRKIPPLAELLAEVDELRRSYELALVRFEERRGRG